MNDLVDSLIDDDTLGFLVYLVYVTMFICIYSFTLYVGYSLYVIYRQQIKLYLSILASRRVYLS